MTVYRHKTTKKEFEMLKNTHVTHTPATTQNPDTLPSIERTVDTVTNFDADVNADEVYRAYEVFAVDKENETAIAVEYREDTHRRQYESDQHPSCRQGNFPTFAEVKGDFIETKWADGSVTVDKQDYFAS